METDTRPLSADKKDCAGRLWIWIALLGFSVFITQVLQPILYPDIWWQLREGQGYLAGGHAAIPTPATFGAIAVPLIHEYVGYEVLLAFFYQWGGWWGVWLLQMLIPLGILFCLTALWVTERPRTNPYWISALGLILLTIILAYRFQARPEVLALVWQVAACCMLLRVDRMGRFRVLCGLCLCSMLWSNTHSSFILLFFICGLWSAEQLLRSLWTRTLDLGILFFCGLMMLLTVFFACLHPEGWNRLLLPLAHQGNHWAIFLTDEMWRPVWIITLNLAIIHVLVVALCVIKLRKRAPFWLLVLGTVFLWMTAQHIRYIGIWTASSMLVFGLMLFGSHEPTRAKPAPRWSPYLVLLSTIVLLLMTLMNLLIYPRWPVEDSMLGGDAVRWVQEQSPEKGAILSDMCAGSYTTWRGRGKILSLLDTGLARFDESTLRTYYYLNYVPEAFEMALDSLDIDYVLIYGRNANLAMVINQHSDWKLVHYNQGQFVYARKQDAEAQEIGMPMIGQGAESFFYGLNREEPGKSLLRLSKHAGTLLSESSFLFVWDWLTRLPAATLEELEKNKPPGTDSQVGYLLSFVRTGVAPAAEVWGDKVWIAAFISSRQNHTDEAWKIIKGYRPAAHASPIQEKCRANVGIEQNLFQKSLVWNPENKLWLRDSIRQMNERIILWKQKGG